MVIINKETEGSKPYEIILGTGTEHTADFIAYASNQKEALDIVADYLVERNRTNLYHCHDEIEIMASCSRWKTAEAFAIDNNLTRCGSHGIYVEHINKKDDLLSDLQMEQMEQM